MKPILSRRPLTRVTPLRKARTKSSIVTNTAEAGLLHARDEEHIAFCVATGRVLFTQDPDFLRHRAAGVEHRGIAFCSQRSRRS